MSIKLLNRVAGALAAVLIAAPCLAADKTTDEDEATDEKPYMEEIIVTATFRETNLMDTPIAITVLDEKSLIDKGIFDIRRLVPGCARIVVSRSAPRFQPTCDPWDGGGNRRRLGGRHIRRRYAGDGRETATKSRARSLTWRGSKS